MKNVMTQKISVIKLSLMARSVSNNIIMASRRWVKRTVHFSGMVIQAKITTQNGLGCERTIAENQ